MTALLQDIKTIGESLRQLSKRTRRYLPDPPRQPPVSTKLQSQLLNDAVTLSKVVKILQETCKQSVRHVGMLGANEGIMSSKLEEFLQDAMDKCDSHVEGAGGIKEVIKEWLTTSLMTMTDLAQVVSEAPMAPKEKPTPPLTIRAQTVKAELDQTRNLKIQLEDKEASIKVNSLIVSPDFLCIGTNNLIVYCIVGIKKSYTGKTGRAKRGYNKKGISREKVVQCHERQRNVGRKVNQKAGRCAKHVTEKGKGIPSHFGALPVRY